MPSTRLFVLLQVIQVNNVNFDIIYLINNSF